MDSDSQRPEPCSSRAQPLASYDAAVAETAQSKTDAEHSRAPAGTSMIAPSVCDRGRK
jgi:hypothetical protein